MNCSLTVSRKLRASATVCWWTGGSKSSDDEYNSFTMMLRRNMLISCRSLCGDSGTGSAFSKRSACTFRSQWGLGIRQCPISTNSQCTINKNGGTPEHPFGNAGILRRSGRYVVVTQWTRNRGLLTCRCNLIGYNAHDKLSIVFESWKTLWLKLGCC